MAPPLDTPNPSLNDPIASIRDGGTPTQSKPGDGPRAVVIGSGFGGLAMAVRLLVRGYQVTVFEKRDGPGGRAYVYKQDGFTFDAGPTIVTAPYLFEELWALCGRRLEDDVKLVSMDPFYKIRFDDGFVFSYSGDDDEMREQIARIDPSEVDNYRRYMDASAEIYQTAFAKLADQPFHKFGVMLGELPAMVRLGGMRSVVSKVGDFFKNEKLRIIFSFHPLLIGGNPLTTTAYYCLIGHLERKYGVHFAMGGTGSLVDGLVRLIESQGGVMRYNAEVDEIIVADGQAKGVRLAGGEVAPADVVISNADPASTYGSLMKAPRRRWSDRKLANADYSMSLFVWYFGTNKQWPDVYHHMMVLGPRYDGLLKDIFSRKRLADDCSLYLHRPTATDPSLAPEGCDAFYVLSPVPNLKSGVDWRAQAEPYRQAVQKRLEETVMPGLGDAIVTSHMITPIDFRDTLNSIEGAAFAMEPKLFQSAWFRPHNISEEIDGLYLVGAGTHPGAGMPGVLCSAKVVDKLLDERARTGAR
ncbi:MAG: phytoene desaturase family protein [Pseudomonadota bacterium]